jgi:hypothetical protein
MAWQQQFPQWLLFSHFADGDDIITYVLSELLEGRGQDFTIPALAAGKIDHLDASSLESCDIGCPCIDNNCVCHASGSTEPVRNDVPDLPEVRVIQTVSDEHSGLCDELIRQISGHQGIVGQNSIVIRLGHNQSAGMSEVSMQLQEHGARGSGIDGELLLIHYWINKPRCQLILSLEQEVEVGP